MTSTEESTITRPDLRPDTWDGFVGQHRVRKTLDLIIGAALARDEAVPHVLLSGPPGLGKTTLAGIIAGSCGGKLTTVAGPALARPGDVAALLMALDDHDVLFVDEIHRLPMAVEEVFYQAMEDGSLSVMVGSDDTARSITMGLAAFTLVGATTRSGDLSAPLRDRFGVHCTVDLYSCAELALVAMRSAQRLGWDLDEDAADEIGRRSRGTPRVANNLMLRARDWATTHEPGGPVIDRACVVHSAGLMGIDERGLDRVDRTIVRLLIDTYKGKPCGLNAMAAATNLDERTIQMEHEPFLVRHGLILRTARGRIAGPQAWSDRDHFMADEIGDLL